MAAKSDTTARTARPFQNPAACEARRVRGGYLISEDADYKMGIIADAMRGIATLCETDKPGHELPEMPARWMASIFLMAAEATDNIRNSAAFTTDEVSVLPRKLN